MKWIKVKISVCWSVFACFKYVKFHSSADIIYTVFTIYMLAMYSQSKDLPGFQNFITDSFSIDAPLGWY